MLENSVLLMGWDSPHATLKVMSELYISEETSFLPHHEKHRMTFRKGHYAKVSKRKEMTGDNIIFFNVIGKKSNLSLIPDADRETPTLGSMDNAGNSVELVSGIIHLLSHLDFSVCIGDR